MKNYIITLGSIIMGLWSMFVYGQELPQVVPPSPTVANLMKFEEVPVSYYTGQPNISVPLYSKAMGNGLGMNIALSYNTQGIKIDNRSGWVGTGWSLFAGGSISRTVRGAPDESEVETAKGVLHLDSYWEYETLSDAEKLEYNWRAVGTNVDKYDTDVDLYQFNFLDHTGRFVIVKENDTLVPKMIGKSQRYKIEPTYNSTYVMSAFTITDAKGFRYIFDVVENTTYYPITGFVTQNNVQTIPASGVSDDYMANSAWHLSSIETSNGIVLATFDYQEVLEDYLVSVTRSYNDILSVSEATIPDILSNAYNIGQLKHKSTVSKFSNSTLTKKLSTITFRDSTKVLFDIISTSHPETGGAVLDRIRIVDARDLNNIVENKRFDLDYWDPSEPSPSRLWLYTVTETAGNVSRDYNFNYNYEHSLAEFDSVAPDPWGYDSGIGSSTINCGGTSIFDIEKIETGLLTSIEYPTGGVKEFKYEHNSYSYIGDQIIGYDDYMENPNNSSPDYLLSNFSHQNQPPGSVFFIDSVTLDFQQDVYLSSYITSSNYPEDYRLELTSNGQGYGGLIEMGEICKIIKDVPAGTYDLNLRVVDLNVGHNISGSARIDFMEAEDNPQIEMIGGGVRIREILFKTSSTATESAKKILYEYGKEIIPGQLNGPGTSSGVIDSKQDRLGRNYTHSVKKMLFDGPNNQTANFWGRLVTYSVREEGVNVDLSQGSYVGYRHVKVSEEGNGYSSYTYTSAYDYPSASATFYLPHAAPKANIDFKRGLLLEHKIFGEDGNILRKVSNLDSNGFPNYAFVTETTHISRYPYKGDGCEFMQFFGYYTAFLNSEPTYELIPDCGILKCLSPSEINNCGGAIPQLSTAFESGWAQLLGTTTTEYFYDGLDVITKESHQDFEYNTDNYQLSQTDTYFNESGVQEQLTTKYYYPTGTSTVATKLLNQNMRNVLLETENFRNGLKLSEVITVYSDFDSDPNVDQLMPESVETSKGPSSAESRIEFHAYDDYGNPLEVSKVDGTRIIYVWGYNDLHPIAKIIGHSYVGISTSLQDAIDAAKYASINDSESVLKEKLEDIRSHADLENAQVSTFTYKPLVGISSMTDPKGYTMTYEYDSFNRLKQVRDQDDNILSKNEYKLRNQY